MTGNGGLLSGNGGTLSGNGGLLSGDGGIGNANEIGSGDTIVSDRADISTHKANVLTCLTAIGSS